MLVRVNNRPAYGCIFSPPTFSLSSSLAYSEISPSLFFFRQWLHLFGYVWRAALAQNDWTLGLHPQCGKHGGYRRRIIQMLDLWEIRSNQLLQQRFDPLMGEDEILRVRIVSESSDLSGFASGFDTDWSYDEEND